MSQQKKLKGSALIQQQPTKEWTKKSSHSGGGGNKALPLSLLSPAPYWLFLVYLPIQKECTVNSQQALRGKKSSHSGGGDKAHFFLLTAQVYGVQKRRGDWSVLWLTTTQHSLSLLSPTSYSLFGLVFPYRRSALFLFCLPSSCTAAVVKHRTMNRMWARVERERESAVW